MSALRLSVCAVLGAAGIVLGMVSPALAASPPNITILSAGPDASGDPYNLTVTANDGNGLQIATMIAHVFSASMQDVADPTMTYVSGPSNDQVWVASPPIAESTLPAGTYTVTVDATDSADGTDAALPAGSFTFAYATSILTVSPSPPSVTQGSQKVTFSGTLTGTAPGGTPVGIANAPVDLSGATSNPVATTDTNGNFSYAATGVQPGTYIFSAPPANNTYPAPPNASAVVSAQQAMTSMTVSPNPATVTEGMQTVTFSGTVTATPPAPASPVGVGSGVPVYLSIGGSTPTQVTQTNDANGDFSYQAQDVAPETVYSFSVNSTALYTAASYSAELTPVAAPTTISVTPSPAVVTFGSPNVAFSGTVTALPGGGTPVPVSGATVYVNGTAIPVPTDSGGHFSYTATGITQNATFTVPASSAGLYSSGSDAVPVDVNPGTTAMTVTANPPDINLATSKVAFTGTVDVTPYAPSGSPAPEGIGTGIPVYLSVGGGPATQVTTTDDANGDFSYTATGVKQAADYVFSVNKATLWGPASESVPIGQNQVQSTLAVTPSPASVTEGSQNVTFTGTVTGVSPGGTTAVPIQKVAIDLSIGSGASHQIGTTDVNGDFTYKVSRVSKQTAYAFSVASSATYTEATDDITVAVDQARTRISHINVTPAHLKYGQSAQLRGTVQYLSGQIWTALPRTAVHLSEGKTSLRAVTTASNGTFTATLPSTHGPGWTAMVDAGSLTLQTSAVGNLTIALPLKVKSFSARLGVNDKITATGCLQVNAPVHDAGPGTFIDVQYSGTSRGPWRTLGRLPLHNSVGRARTCRSDDQSSFSGKLPSGHANGYYRADFVATDSFQSALSKAIHAWKYPTRIVSFTANKHKVSNNGLVRFTGRLEVKVKSWRGWGRQPVTILENVKGTSFWSPLTTSKTNSGGHFTVWIAGIKGNFVAIIYAMYAGNGTHLACLSRGIAVQNDNDSPDVPAPPAGSVGSESVPPSLAQLARLPVPATPMLPEFTTWPSIASLARIES